MEKTNETKVEEYIESGAWDIIKEKLEEKIRILDSIDSIPEDIKDIAKEIDSRKGAISVIREWMQEIEGIAIQNKQGRDIMEKEEIVRTYE